MAVSAVEVMVRNEVPLVYNTCKAILHALQFREVLFGNVV